MTPELQALVSLWGAVLATLLAVIKVWEVLQERPRLFVSYSFSSDPCVGNKIYIRNNSKVPALIEYWDLVWACTSLGWVRFERVETTDDVIDPGFTIPGHGQHTLHFADADYFVTRQKIDGYPVRLYLRLHMAGRQTPAWMLVWKA